MKGRTPGEGKTLFRLPRNVVLLGWTSFMTDAGSEMILPVLPLFMRGALAAPMTVIGLVEGVADFTANTLKLASGWWSDRLGRSKPFVYVGYGLSAVVKPLLALAATWHFVLGVRFMDRVGKGLRTAPRDALVAASTPREIYGKAFGFHRAMDTAGAMLGSAFAAAALWFLQGDIKGPGIRWFFALSVIPSLLAILFIVPVREVPVTVPASGGKKAGAAASRAFGPAVWFLLAGVALWELGNISYAFVLVRINELGVATSFVPLVYFGYNAVYTLTAMPVGMLTDRIGIRAALMFAPLLGAAAFFVMGMESLVPVAVGGMILYALHSAAVNTVPRAAVAHFGTPGARGTLFGLVGACALGGNLMAGLLWDHVGAPTALRMAGGLSLLSLIPFGILCFRKER